MSPSRLAAATLGALVAAALAPSVAAAHAIGGTFELPVPLWLYLAGAATAVAASFVVVVLGRRRAGPQPSRHAAVPPSLARVTHRSLQVVGLAWWYGAIVAGFVVGDISPLPAVLLWVGIWIALPILAATVGNAWPSLSPFRTTHAAVRAVAARIGLDADAGLVYPRILARWPAVALLGVAIWCELILPGGAVAGRVASLMTGYTLLTVLGALAFGRSWLRNAELFEVLLGWYGRIGPLRGRVVRGWFGGLRRVRGLGWSDAAFVVLLLAGITYDGVRETALGAAILRGLLPPIEAAFGSSATAFLLVDTVALAGMYAAFLAAFAAALGATRSLMRTGADPSAGRSAGGYAATLLPIAAGYLIAHYLTLVIQAVVWLPALLADPLMSIAPSVDWIPIGFVWYLSVAAIVGGHVAGVALAHRLTVRWAPRAAVRAGIPMVLLMIGYTVLSLWIIAQPIVVEPGTTPGAASAAEARR